MAERHFRRTGNAVEVGVYRGGFSHHALQFWSGKYWMVDAWDHRNDSSTDKNNLDPKWHHSNYAAAQRATLRHRSRVTMVPSLSVDAAGKFPEGYFDWLFLDALHTREAVLQDLEAWWPRLRAGGLCSGDDYGDAVDTEYLKFATRPANISAHPSSFFWGIPRGSQWGVIRGVQQFARRVGAVLHVGWLHGQGLLDETPTCYTWPAWYMIKPFADDAVDPRRVAEEAQAAAAEAAAARVVAEAAARAKADLAGAAKAKAAALRAEAEAAEVEAAASEAALAEAKRVLEAAARKTGKVPSRASRFEAEEVEALESHE